MEGYHEETVWVKDGFTLLPFQIKDVHLTRFLNGLAEYYGYQTAAINGPIQQTKAQYIREKILSEWTARVRRIERRQALEALSIDSIEVIDE